ncbi:MAG: glutamate racemase [Pseudomonadota bacterium]
MTEDEFFPEATGRVLVFDSGVGGVTVAQEISAIAPKLIVDYAADTGFFPYGDKSDEALRARLPVVARALVHVAQPDVFVIACNTASTLALPDVRAVLDIPVVGTVPAIKPAAEASQTGHIGLLATPGTIRRDYTQRLIEEFAADTEIVKLGSVELVRLAEAFAAGEEVSMDAVAAAQAPLFEGPTGAKIDTVVLACTHFPLLREMLADTAPHPVRYIDSGQAIARQTLRVLEDRGAATGPKAAYITSEPAEEPGTMHVLNRFGYRRPVPVSTRRKGTTSPEVA